MIYFSNTGLVYAQSDMQTVTYMITDNDFKNKKIEGPEIYEYDDGVFYGTLTRVSTTWEIAVNTSNTNSWGLVSDNLAILNSNPPSLTSTYWDSQTAGYDNVHDKKTTWISETEESKYWIYGGGFEGVSKEWTNAPNDGTKVYRYRRLYRGYFKHNSYKYTSTYSGLVMSRNNKPLTNHIKPEKNSYFSKNLVA